MISPTRTLPSSNTGRHSFMDDALGRDRYELGRSLLGPVFHEFCHQLWRFEREYADRQAMGLYMARGGLRLGHLYETFLERNQLAAPVPHLAFPASRLAAVKVSMSQGPDLVAAAIAEQFSHDDCRSMARCLLPRAVCADRDELVAELPANLGNASVTPAAFLALYRADTPYSKSLRRHFAEQEELFDEWMKPLAAYRTLLLIDTGWYGSTQAAYMRTRPQWEWIGVYFGRWNYGRPSPPHFSHVHGLVIDSDRRRPDRRAMALLRHRHLIEMPLEPIGMESVEYYFRDETGRVRSNLDPITMDAQTATMDEPFFTGVHAYFTEAPVGLSSEAIRSKCECSLARLSEMILHPDRRTAELLAVPDRGADFGKTGTSPVFCRTADNETLLARLLQVRRALWREGQAAISFPRRYALVQALMAIQWRCPRTWRLLKRFGKWVLGMRCLLGPCRWLLGKYRCTFLDRS